MGLYTDSGKIRITDVSGNSVTGLRSPSGAYNVVFNYTPLVYCGLYHPSGAYNVTELNTQVLTSPPTGVYAPNGSLYVSFYSNSYGIPHVELASEPLVIDGTIHSSLDIDFTTSTLLMNGVSKSLSSAITCARASTGIAQRRDGTLVSFPSNTLRITDKGILVELGTTNQCRNNTMVGASAGVAPTNWSVASGSGLTATVLGVGVENGYNYLQVRLSGTAVGTVIRWSLEANNVVAAAVGQVWTHSIYISEDPTSAQVGTNLIPQVEVREFNAGVGLIQDATNATPTIGNLWLQRFSHTRTLTDATTTHVNNNIRWDFTNGVTYDRTFRIGLPQLESGVMATSPILTSTVAVTRNTDAVTMTGANFTDWYNTSGGSIYYDADHWGVSKYAWSLSDGTSSERVITLTNSTGFLNSQLSTTAVVQATHIGEQKLTFTLTKGVYSFADSYSQCCFNGAIETLDSVVTLPTGMNRLIIGGSATTTGQLNGYIRRLVYFEDLLTDAQMSELTAKTLDINFQTGTLRFDNSTYEMEDHITCTRASTGYAEKLDGTLVSFATNTLRRTDKGLLSEPLSTNVLNSAMTGANVGTNTLPTGWSATNPIDGLTRTVVGTGTELGRPYVDIRWSGMSGAAGTTTIMFFNGNSTAALNGETWTSSLDLALVDGSLSTVASLLFTVRYNNAGGTILTSADSASLLGVTATRQPFAVTATASDAATAWVTMTLVANFNNSTDIDFTLRFYVPQLEKSPVRTSPIIGAANTTRNADIITMTGRSFTDWWSATEGTFVFDGDVGAAAFKTAFSVNDNTNSNEFTFRTNSLNNAEFLVSVATVTQAALTTGSPTYTETTPIKAAMTYKAADFANSYNGGTVGTDASGTLPTVNQFMIGARGAGSVQHGAYIRSLTYTSTRLPNADLQALTS